MTELSTQHATFTIERTLAAPPARVFAAFATVEAKDRWFAGDGEWLRRDHHLDFRVGGREHLGARLPGGLDVTFDAEYRDIVPDRRIVYVYDMTMNAARISVSVATIALEADGAGTRLVVTEQGVFLDGLDNAAEREKGTGELLDNLAASLEAETAEAAR